jgi:hypothetical protein
LNASPQLQLKGSNIRLKLRMLGKGKPLFDCQIQEMLLEDLKSAIWHLERERFIGKFLATTACSQAISLRNLLCRRAGSDFCQSCSGLSQRSEIPSPKNR